MRFIWTSLGAFLFLCILIVCMSSKKGHVVPYNDLKYKGGTKTVRGNSWIATDEDFYVRDGSRC